MRWAQLHWRKAVVLASLVTSMVLLASPLKSQDLTSEEEKREQVAAERFLELLVRRPTAGTALERVFGFHVARGDLSELLTELRQRAEKASAGGERDVAGRHWMVIGLLQLQRGEEAAAAGALAQAETLLNSNPLAAYYRGQALSLVGRETEAAEAMQRAIDLNPPRREFLTIASQLGRLYQRAGDVDAAMATWERLEASFPGDDRVRQQIARALAEEGDAAGALQRYDSLAADARSPNDRIVFALRAADVRLQLGQKERATNDLEELLGRLRPGSYLYAEARRRIEAAYLNSGDYAGLVGYYEGWLEKHPDDMGAILRLARTLSAQGRGAEALRWLEKAIERSPTDEAPRLVLIDAYLSEDRFADAAEQFRILAEKDPDNPDYLVRWGQILLEDPKQPESERRQRAAEIWDRLAQARSDDPVIQSQVADLLRGAGLNEAALDGYRKAIALSPAESQYKEYLGEFLYRLDRKDEALQTWRSLAEGEARSRENLVRLAEVLHQFDQAEEALRTLSEACEMDPTLDERLRLAEWLRDAGSFQASLSQLSLAAEASDTVDDRDRVFASQLATYQAAGQLAERIDQAKQAAEAAVTDGELWRRLAVLYDADRQTRESLLAIELALKHSGDAIETLDVAARMYEAAGRFQDAVQKRRQLADSDRRFRSGHLQRLASLYMRMGQADRALQAGAELLAGGGGAIEGFRFYADLCGQVGRLDERLDTLRRCLRVNPRSKEAQEMLASQLAEDFKTEQAVELYWKILDSAKELEDRRSAITKLADLYLRSNRLDQLIARLEIRGRETGDRRGTIDLVATAYQQAGDLGLARDALEGLLREQGRDTLLLQRLVSLAELSGEYERAVELQRQLHRLAPSRQVEAKLASLLVDVGSIDEAESLWLQLAEHETDRQRVSRNISRLFAAGESKIAANLADRALARDSTDWEAALQLMVLQASEGQWEDAVVTANKLRKISQADTALPAGGKPFQRRVVSGGQTYFRPPLRFTRIQGLYELYRILDERYGHNQTSQLPKPMDFGHAKLMALWVIMKHEHQEGDLRKIIKSAEQAANAPDATSEEVWQWYEMATAVSSLDQELAMNAQNPASWEPLWKLVEKDAEVGEIALMQFLSSRSSYRTRSVNVNLTQLPAERLLWLKERAAQPASTRSQGWYGAGVSWPSFYQSEMRIAGREQEAQTFFEEQLTAAKDVANVENVMALLQEASIHADDDQLWSLIERLLKGAQNPALQRRFRGSLAAGCMTMFSAQQRIDQQRTAGPDDPVYRQRVAKLLDAMISEQASKPLRRKTLRLSAVGGQRTTHVMNGGNYQRVQIEFPPKGLGPDDQFIAAIWNVWNTLKDHQFDWATWLKETHREDADPRERVLREILAASIWQWDEQPEKAAKQISSALEIATDELPHYEPELRLMLADLMLRQGRKQEALDTIDALAVYDQSTMAVREFAAAKLASAMGDKQRAQAASKRLFGVRLDTEAQIELAKLMRALDMHDLASDLVRRMRSRGGSNTDQLNALMTYFAAQGDNDQAAAVAMELLRRSAPSRRQSTRYTTAAQARRRSAIQTLASTGRLSALIEAAEERLKRSPKSQRIRGELAEMYMGAGKSAKAQELLTETVEGNVQSAAALLLAAKQLTTSGKFDDACDAYLAALRRKQDSFSQEYYEIKQPFERTKRLGDLADLIIDVGVKRFEMHRIGELCSEMLREKQSVPKARNLYLAILEGTGGSSPRFSSNPLYVLNNVIGSGRDLLDDEEVLNKTQDYMVSASLRANSWSVLFNGYSTSSDGRHRNAAMNLVREIGKDSERSAALETLLRGKLAENEDWHEGRALLGTLLVISKKHDEAERTLEFLFDKKLNPAPTYATFWLIGSLIDEHQRHRPLALRMYRHAMDHSTNTRNSSDFRFSLEYRTCQLLSEMGQKEDAKDMLFHALEKMEKGPSPYAGNEEYEAYRKIRSTISIVEFLDELGFAVDALRMARSFDMSLFDQAGRYQRNQRETFKKQRDSLLAKVRAKGGLETIEAMVDASTAGAEAVDLGITLGERPFSGRGIQCLWAEMLSNVIPGPGSQGLEQQKAERLEGFVRSLEQVSKQRADDDTAALAYAAAAHAQGKTSPLIDLVTHWKAADVAPENTRSRERLLAVAVCLLSGSERDDDGPLTEEIAFESSQTWGWEARLALLAELGRRSLEKENLAQAQRLWSAAKECAQSQLILLDLARAAADAEMLELSVDAAVAAADAPVVGGETAIPSKTTDLGALLGIRRSNSSIRSRDQGRPDPAETTLAQRLIELDEVWRRQRMRPATALEALWKFVAASNDSNVRPLCLPVEVAAKNRLKVDSVLDRAAKLAKRSGKTQQLLSRFANDDALSHLLSGLLLLRADDPAAAAKHYAAAQGEELKSLPQELVFQALLPALEDATCRTEAIRLGIALVGVNKPEQRYQSITPFDTLSLRLAEVAARSGHAEYREQAIKDYLELTDHDNSRYSGNSGVRRRGEQLNRICQVLIDVGQIEQALPYAGMRQAVFDMGLDTSNDTVGIQILDYLHGMSNRAQAYQMLADWSLEGDGPVRFIQGILRQPSRPDWMPESVAGVTPTLLPTAFEPFPIVTNWYLLAQLADEVGTAAELLGRLQVAVQKGRVGAAEALAITQAAYDRPVTAELLRVIDERNEANTPADNRDLKAALPLTAMQLATLLADRPEHADWAKQATTLFAKHATSSRRYILPWHFRFQYLQGWADAGFENANSLQHWIGASAAGAAVYARGGTPPLWLTDGKSQLNHVCGFGSEQFWFRYPLRGDFEFHVETIDAGWRESGLLANGLRIWTSGDYSHVHVQSPTRSDWVRFTTELLKKGEWNKYTVRFQGESVSYLVDGQLLYEETRAGSSPWVGLHCANTRYSGARNIRISGDPEIPRSLKLLAKEDLRGWSGVYYYQPLPTARLNKEPRDPVASETRAIRTGIERTRTSDLAWTVDGDELVSGNATKRGPSGQSVIRYDRPLSVGDTLSYEFYYQAGKFGVHPSLGRTAYLFRPEGVQLHWMTEPNAAGKTLHNYELLAPGSAPQVPLKENGWNRVELRLDDEQLSIQLNDKLVYQGEFETPPHGAVFGLFHYATKTRVRVRDVQLAGAWPEELPSELFKTANNR